MRTASARARASRIPCASAARAALLLCAAMQLCGAQLVSQPAAPNPFSGQGEIPRPFTAADFPVDTRMVAFSLLDVDEKRNLASVFLYWMLSYEAPESVENMRANYTTTCAFYCSSKPAQTLNSAGQPACCDNVFVPAASAFNSRAYLNQEYADIRFIGALSPAQIQYFRTIQGRFAFHWSFGSFPFDSHYVLVDILTGFKPILSRRADLPAASGFSLVDGYAHEGLGKLRVASDPAHYRPSIRSTSLPAWDVEAVHIEITQQKRKFNKNLTAAYIASNGASDGVMQSQATQPGFLPLPPGQWRGGQVANYAVRLYIKIRRRSTGFWVMTCILPVALVTIFGFGVQSLPRQALKARAELLSTIFLSLVLLQTVLHTFMPPHFLLTLPIKLTLVGYVYTLLLFMVIIMSHAMEDQWRRRELKVQRRWASQVFSMWADRLEQGPSAQEALAQSTASSAVPFDVTREQVMNPLQGSRAKQKKESEGQKSAAAASDASNELAWIIRHRSSWWFRIPPIRFFVEWWKFTGRESSQDYCRLMANRFDQGARLLLLVSYVGVVVALCLTAFAGSDREASAPLFPQ